MSFMRTSPRWLLTLAALALSVAPLVADEPEKLPPGRKLVKITATPAKIELNNKFAYSQVVLTGVLDNGEKLDVTRMAELTKTPAQVKVDAQRLVRPVADGKGSLQFRVGEKSVDIPFSVTNQKKDYRVSFVRDVMPVMSKAGCNAGTCHGSAKGKNGFQLSLRGYDPTFDHRALTDDVMGRRFNRAAPDRSLMLLKPSGQVAHVGGVLMQPGDPTYEIIRSWINDGVKLDSNTPRVVSIRVTPAEPVIPLPEMKQQMQVIATYPNGSTRDVTAEAFLESSNTEVAKVDPRGLVRALRRGETAILARYEGKYAAAPLIVMGDRTGFVWKDVPEYNYIDKLVYDKLKRVKVQAGELCTDAEFVRRVYLDLTGLPPSAETVKKFLADPTESRKKREQLVDQLIGNPDFVDHWTNKWADLLQVNSKFLGLEGARKFRSWIHDAVKKNMPYDKFSYAILTAQGSNMQNPAAAYWKILREPDEAMENTTHLFLAVRFNCNKCHDHPFERWTQDDYYHLAAYFSQVGRKGDPKFKGKRIGGTAVMGAQPLVEIIFDKNNGNMIHKRTGQVAQPEFPFLDDKKVKAETRREQLAKWITTSDNPYFAKSYVNRVWGYLLGVGLIEPIDDIRAGNPPTNPALLKRLTEEFVKSGFNVRKIMRDICTSRTYQHSIKTSKWNADDKINYSHALARRLPAEVLFDAIHKATGSTARIPGLPPGARASELVNANVKLPGDFLKQLGRPPRESSCECERSNNLMLAPVLNLVNGEVLNNAVADPSNRINVLVAKEKDDAKVVREMWLSILNRPATESEVKLGLKYIAEGKAEWPTMIAKRKQLEKAVRDHEAQLDAKQPAWEASLKRVAKWTQLGVDGMKSNNKKTTFKKLPDGSVLVGGPPMKNELYTITTKTDLQGISAIRLEALTDKSLGGNGPGRSDNGNFVLNEFQLFVQPVGKKAKPKRINFGRAIADFSQQNFDVNRARDNRPNTGWAIHPQTGKNHVAIFETRGRVGYPKGTKLTLKFLHRYQDGKHVLGRFRLSVTKMSPPLSLKLLPKNIARILDIPAEKRNPQQKNVVRDFYRAKDQQLPKLREALNDYPVPNDPRGVGAQDLAWALLNSRAFLFNR